MADPAAPGPVTGKRYRWLCQEQAMVSHWYFYGFDVGFGAILCEISLDISHMTRQ